MGTRVLFTCTWFVSSQFNQPRSYLWCRKPKYGMLLVKAGASSRSNQMCLIPYVSVTDCKLFPRTSVFLFCSCGISFLNIWPHCTISWICEIARCLSLLKHTTLWILFLLASLWAPCVWSVLLNCEVNKLCRPFILWHAFTYLGKAMKFFFIGLQIPGATRGLQGRGN